MILDDNELRHMIVALLRKPSARTLQTRIGASDLSDGCDRCLAMKMRGLERTSPQADRPWFGAEWGTAGHMLMESRINELLASIHDDTLSPEQRQATALQVESAFGLPAGTRVERRLLVAEIPGYGPVYGTIDLDLPDQIGDFKGSTRKKSALLQDYLAEARGEELRRWVKQKDTARGPGGYKLNLGSDAVVALSHTKYREAMDGMVHKMNGYFGQQTMYLHGRALEGRPVSRGSIIWLNRDGNGYFDDPGANRYEDPTANRDVWILSFDYNADYAQHLIDRAAWLWAQMEAGAAFADFEQAAACYVCSFEEKERLADKAEADVPVTIGGAPVEVAA